MAFETEGANEKGSKGKLAARSQFMTLQKAVEMGEYDPEYLATFPEWHILSQHMQFQYIKSALDNRNKQLLSQWAEVNNFLDFSLKPHLKDALENIQKQMKKVERDREKLYLEYSKF